MDYTLEYVRQHLLNAGTALQRILVNAEQLDELTSNVHDAQNHLALGLATLMQIMHDESSSINEKRIDDSIFTVLPADELATQLREQAGRRNNVGPLSDGAYVYTNTERSKLLNAAALLESLHPSLLDE